MDQIVSGSSRHIYFAAFLILNLLSTKKLLVAMELAKRSNRVEKAVLSTPAERLSKYVIALWSWEHPPSILDPM
jgi:hypothetical protein